MLIIIIFVRGANIFTVERLFNKDIKGVLNHEDQNAVAVILNRIFEARGN